jgi:hypothetical protein
MMIDGCGRITCIGVAERDKVWAKQLADMRERVKSKPLLIETDKRDLERIEVRTPHSLPLHCY